MDDTTSTITRLTPAERRQLGSFYTPSPVVGYIVRGCLRGSLRRSGTILDPTCGDGMFLIGAAEEIFAARRSSAPGRLKIVRERIFGVDLDPEAIQQARQRLESWIAPRTAEMRAETERVLAANLRVGNTLIGKDFSGTAKVTEGFSWHDAFPQIAAAGGFDLVLGNPPYRRELAAKALFDTIAQTPLGEQWRQPRMDLWYYFLHRGLDLLRPGGALSFIVNSYWTASRGAEKLIERLRQETTLYEVVLLGTRKIFDGVTGRHLIVRLRKARSCSSCRVIALENRSCPFPDSSQELDEEIDTYELQQDDLYTSGGLTLARPLEQAHLFDACRLLGEAYDTAQGMAENPPRVNRRLAQKLGGTANVGDGVFVLSDDEVAQLDFNAAERALLRPYFETATLDRYALPDQPSHQVLYLTRDTAATLDEFPNVRRHLKKYRKVLEQRRETRQGQNAWWHLHWPRQQRIFTEPAILSIQMGRVPRFVMASSAAYVGFSVNLISARTLQEPSLATLTGILNSSIAAAWFARHAKQRGVNLEINLHVLRRFPLPPRDAKKEQQLAELVHTRQAGGSAVDYAQQEARIDKIVAGLYGVREQA
ncbi:Eco57I restriction-modification methylase [Symmachiella dynata]|uniref:Eco57I restriction-modification methylase domain-containing protein n=1 Tax=Symmachiella dynata TaxID=2527995 RepID=UPI0011897BB7|nr:N-6 DNA methylase [Symmachiella dynata]QDT46841.1 Eco57I restriction-modification methylase [Symmachiella dynata]